MAVDNLVIELGKIGTWLQAVGLIIILWLIFQAIGIYLNRKRRKLLGRIDERLKVIEGKIDRQRLPKPLHRLSHRRG